MYSPGARLRPRAGRICEDRSDSRRSGLSEAGHDSFDGDFGSETASPGSQLDWATTSAHHERAWEDASQLAMRTAFIGFNFERDRALAGHVEALLESHGIRSVTGEVLGGGALTPAIVKRIAQADGFIGLLTAREPTGNGEYSTHSWVHDELVVAKTKRKPAVALVDPRVKLNGAYQEDEKITFDAADPLPAFVKLSLTISQWKADYGRLIKVRVLPESLGRRLGAARYCEYRLINDGRPGKWQRGELFNEVGGLVAYVPGTSDNSLIELRITRGDQTWASPAAPQFMHLWLKQGA